MMLLAFVVFFAVILTKICYTQQKQDNLVATCNLNDPFCRVWNHRDTRSKCTNLCKSQFNLPYTGKHKKNNDKLSCLCENQSVETFSDERELSDKIRYKSLIFG